MTMRDQRQRYTGLVDMFDGGGAGRAGDRFEGGGAISDIGNAMFRPYGYNDRMQAQAQQQGGDAAQMMVDAIRQRASGPAPQARPSSRGPMPPPQTRPMPRPPQQDFSIYGHQQPVQGPPFAARPVQGPPTAPRPQQGPPVAPSSIYGHQMPMQGPPVAPPMGMSSPQSPEDIQAMSPDAFGQWMDSLDASSANLPPEVIMAASERLNRGG